MNIIQFKYHKDNLAVKINRNFQMWKSFNLSKPDCSLLKLSVKSKLPFTQKSLLILKGLPLDHKITCLMISLNILICHFT